MTVLQLEKDKFKIILTHTEVILCFGSYERLKGMGINVRAAIKTLVSDIVFEKGEPPVRAAVTVASKEDLGAHIFLILKRKTPEKTVVHFNDGNALADAMIILYKRGITTPCSLYKMEKGYRIVLNEPVDSLYVINEFARFIKGSYILAENTDEYGKLLIRDNAIERLAVPFLKRF